MGFETTAEEKNTLGIVTPSTTSNDPEQLEQSSKAPSEQTTMFNELPRRVHSTGRNTGMRHDFLNVHSRRSCDQLPFTAKELVLTPGDDKVDTPTNLLAVTNRVSKESRPPKSDEPSLHFSVLILHFFFRVPKLNFGSRVSRLGQELDNLRVWWSSEERG